MYDSETTDPEVQIIARPLQGVADCLFSWRQIDRERMFRTPPNAGQRMMIRATFALIAVIVGATGAAVWLIAEVRKEQLAIREIVRQGNRGEIEMLGALDLSGGLGIYQCHPSVAIVRDFITPCACQWHVANTDGTRELWRHGVAPARRGAGRNE